MGDPKLSQFKYLWRAHCIIYESKYCSEEHGPLMAEYINLTPEHKIPTATSNLKYRTHELI